MANPLSGSRRSRARFLSVAARGVEALEGRKLFAATAPYKTQPATPAKSVTLTAKTVDLKHKAALTTAAPLGSVTANATAAAASLLINNDTKSYVTLPDTTVTLTGKSELRITGSGNPITNSLIHLNSSDAWVFLTGIKPSAVNSTYLSQFRVNGAAAVSGTNVRVVQYELGTVVIPHGPGYQPLTTFTGPNFTGTAKSFGQYTYHNSSGALGTAYKNVSSFKLKRGYMATVATQTNGTGFSKVYVAQDSDVDVALMPGNLDNAIQFIYVVPWRWVSKKGASDLPASTLDAAWSYNWNNSMSSSLDAEYVPIRQQRWWPGYPYNKPDTTELLGFNEPDNPVEDAYKSLDNGNVDTAIAVWPDLMGTGLRLGSPAVTDGGKAWLYSFMDKAIARNLRVDFIAIHNYQANKTAASFKAWLQEVWDKYHKPIWVTEFNNGANWTGSKPTYQQNADAIGSFIDMMDNTPWIERYSVYSAVEDTRQMTYADGSLTPAGVIYKNNASPIGYVQEAVPGTNTAGRSVAKLPMDGNTNDVSGYGNNGQATGVPAYAAGKTGQALVLDGVDDYVRLTDNVGRGNGFTFASWVNWDGGTDWQRLFDFGNDTNQYAFLTPATGGKMRFAIKNYGNEQVVQTATALPIGQWTHVAVTLDGATARIYLNGTLSASGAVTIRPADFAPAFNYLGKSQYPDPLFKGKLDDVTVSDTAMTAAQVAALAATNAAPQFTAAELTRGPVRPGTAFSGTIAGTATDADAGDTVTYAKANGPSWLTVAANGILSGTPAATDTGPQEFVVTATDGRGATTSATLTLTEVRGVVQLAFDGSAADTGGFGNTPALVGSPVYVTGKRGQALSLSGSGQYVQMTSNVAHGDEFTFAGWVNWNGGASWQRVFDFGNDTSSYLFLTPSNGSQMQFSLYSGSTGYDLRTSTLAVNAWTHLAVTIGAGVARLYVNGAVVASVNGVTLKPGDLRPTNNYLGKSQFAADPLFAGRLDDVNVSDVALTQQQIAALMSPNAAPTVQAAAAAVGNGTKRANVSVLGADDNGETTLTYTWSAAGPAPVTFSVNGTNAAKNAVATFGKVGTYTFTATITDSAGLSVTSVTTYTVLPVQTSVLVTPAATSVNAGQSLASTAVVKDQFGTDLLAQPALTWAVEEGGGTISNTGVYTAPASGSGTVMISASTAVGLSGFALFDRVDNTTVPTLVSAVSRRTTVSGTNIDLALALGNTPTVESRAGGPSTLVLTFSEPMRPIDGLLDGTEFAIANAQFVTATLSGVTLTLSLADVVDATDVAVTLLGMSSVAGTALAAGTAITIRSLTGDATGDGHVDFNDFLDLQVRFGTTSATYVASDFDANGTVDFNDFLLLQINFGRQMS